MGNEEKMNAKEMKVEIVSEMREFMDVIMEDDPYKKLIKLLELAKDQAEKCYETELSFIIDYCKSVVEDLPYDQVPSAKGAHIKPSIMKYKDLYELNYPKISFHYDCFIDKIKDRYPNDEDIKKNIEVVPFYKEN